MTELIKGYVDNLNSMKKNIDNEIREILLRNKTEIINLVKHGQLEQGINSYGKIVGRYAFATSGYAKAQGVTSPKKLGSPYNFYWSGQTIENMGFKLSKKSYDVFTITGKQKMLQELYGELFQLTEEHNDYVNKKIIEPNLVKWISENWWKTVG